MGDCPIARSAGVSRQGREAHSSAATTFGRASPSAVAEQANSALEPTALRAAAHRQAVDMTADVKSSCVKSFVRWASAARGRCVNG